MKCNVCNGVGTLGGLKNCIKCNGKGFLPEIEVGGIVVTAAGGAGKVEVNGVFVPQLTIEELRDQFEVRYKKPNQLQRDSLDNYQYFNSSVNRDWLIYVICANANNILREG